MPPYGDLLPPPSKAGKPKDSRPNRYYLPLPGKPSESRQLTWLQRCFSASKPGQSLAGRALQLNGTGFALTGAQFALKATTMNKNAGVTETTSSRHHGNLKIAKQSAPKPPALTERDLLGMHQLWQRSLDPHELLSRLQEEVARFVPFDSFVYQHSAAKLNVSCGKNQTHRCSYQLNLEKQPLGELAITRSKRFSEDEMYTLERLVSTWIYSLRNSIDYQGAIQRAYTDLLTGLLNRNALENLFSKEIQRATRDQSDLSVLLIDVDGFKQINDRFGHAIGDQVLRHVAHVVVKTIRRSDMVFRHGGEEFVILLPNTDPAGAECVGDKIRRATESTLFDLKGLHIPITISVGVTSMQSGDTPADLIDKADRAMYCAKAAGRNCLRSA